MMHYHLLLSSFISFAMAQQEASASAEASPSVVASNSASQVSPSLEPSVTPTGTSAGPSVVTSALDASASIAQSASVPGVSPSPGVSVEVRTLSGSDVNITPNHPEAVNLGAVLQGLANNPPGHLLENRIKGLSADSPNVTVLVEHKTDIANSSNAQYNTTEWNIDMTNLTDVYCTIDKVTPDWTTGWPCAVAEALRLAGWDISKPIDSRQALQAISGFKADAGFIHGTSNWSNQTILESHLDPTSSPWIVTTKKDRNEVAAGLKTNYAYSMTKATDEDKIQFKTNETFRLDDPAIENKPILISWAIFNQSAQIVWGIHMNDTNMF